MFKPRRFEGCGRVGSGLLLGLVAGVGCTSAESRGLGEKPLPAAVSARAAGLVQGPAKATRSMGGVAGPSATAGIGESSRYGADRHPERRDRRPFFREYADREAPRFVSGGRRAPHGPGAAVELAVEPRRALRSLPRTLYGNNAAVWDGGNLQALELFDRLSAVNMPLLRFPGGSTSDTYHFDGVYPPHAVAQGWDNMSQPWAASTAEYMYMVRRLGAIPLITANYGYATYDTTSTDGNVVNAARLAADWVEYCNAPDDGKNPNGGKDWAHERTLGGSSEPFAVKYWEIGNESFGSWEVGYDPDGSTYAENFKVIADAMKAVDPSIAIGLVTQVDSPGQPWTATVLGNPGTLERADFLVIHNYFMYFTDPSQIDAQVLLAQAGQVGERKAWLDELVATNAPGHEPLPYYLGEYNGTIPANPLELSLANGLFISKVLGELASTGYAAASFWAVLNSYGTDPNNPALGAGDLGFLSSMQPGVPDFVPRPTYYPFYFFTRNFGDHLVEVSSSDPEVTAYASSFTGGGVGVVAINEGSAPKRLSIALEHPGGEQRANAWILTGDSLEAQSVTLNGRGVTTLVGGPAPETVEPYSLNVDRGRYVVTLPKYSVGSVVIY